MKLNIAQKLMIIMMLTTIIVVGMLFGLSRITTNIWILSGAALAIAALAAFALSRDLVNAIQQLLEGTRSLTAGDLWTRISLTRTDELGQLADHFNALALTLRQQDIAKKQWITDTSHELRTPIAVLRAQIEALQDGVQKADPKTLGVLHGEIVTLSKLVDDLHDLSKSDLGQLRYDMVPVDVGPVVIEVVEAFADRFAAKGISVDAKNIENLNCIIEGDVTRLKQLFANLLENSRRYTNENGRVRITATKQPTELVLHFDDSEPTASDEALGRIFERFFRTESSRSRAHGGAGLGLPICKAIVEAHHGTIDAARSSLGGLQMIIRFPVQPL